MASLMRTALLLLLLILILHEADGWRRRRRRRIPSCKPRNCQVAPGWSPWSPCSHRCGSTGTQYRTRRKIVSESCGGRCPFIIRKVKACNRNACQNGGSPAPGYCRCPVGFKGTCCEIAKPTPKPTPKRDHILRILLKLLKIFKTMLKAIEAVIRVRLDGYRADYHKREIVSMMKRVDETAHQIEDSSEPAALQAKQKVAEMRMRAMKVLEKLNDYIDPEFENKN